MTRLSCSRAGARGGGKAATSLTWLGCWGDDGPEQQSRAGGCSLESQNYSGWKRPVRSASPTINPIPPCLLNHVLKCHIHMFFEPLQGWRIHHCPGQPGPMPDHSFSKEIFPNLKSKPPWTQLEAVRDLSREGQQETLILPG